MLSNTNAPLAPQQDNRLPSTFALPSEQQIHFTPQSQAPMPQSQAPSSRMNDFMNNSSHNMNSSNHNMNGGWDLPPASGGNMGGTWSSNHNISLPTANQQPGFQPHAAPRPLSENPFLNHGQSHQNAPAAMPMNNSNPVSDDSLMVDNLFASLGVAGNDGDGLLTALNSVSLAGPSQQQGADWGGNITGWGSGDDSSKFLQHSRLGDYREE